VALIAAAFVALGHVRLMQWIGAYLVVDDPLAPAVAIIVLSGGFPVREMEAAELYGAGVAPRLVLVPERQNTEPALRAQGLPTTSDLRREVLVRQGVPDAAVFVLDDEADATFDELQIAARTIQPDGAPVVLVSSWYHTRRVSLIWSRVARAQSRAMVRSARLDPSRPDSWWRDAPSILAVIREYVGLLDAWAGFPMASRRYQGRAQ
jgi:uncharacterized SAM-binding protein YcdF (DUF218 family)